MNKILRNLIIELIFSLGVLTFSAHGETITLTTYYPSPYGIYNKLQTRTISVGDNNGDGKVDSNDLPTYTDIPLEVGGSIMSHGGRIYFTGADNTGNFWINMGMDEGGSPLTNPDGDNVIGWNNASSFAGREIYLQGTTYVGFLSPNWAQQNMYISGNVGIGMTNPSYRLDVNGTIHATGNSTYTSDIRYKKQIKELTSVLPKLKNIRAIKFKWDKKKGKEKGISFPDGFKIGIPAQDVEKFFPELVSYDKKHDIKSLNYSQFTSVLLAAIKEQQEIIRKLKEKISTIEKEVKLLKK